MIFAVSIALASCAKVMYGAKDLGTYDKTVPKEETAVLVIKHSSKVTEFDGNAVEWKRHLVLPESFIRIPAGTHRVKYTYEYSIGGGSPPRQEIRNNRRVTVMTTAPRYEEKYDRDVTVTFDADKIYELGKETITVYNGWGVNYYRKWK